MKFLPDLPIAQGELNTLGSEDFVDTIYSALQNTESPFVYGVLGDWGSGKTSILKILHSKLSKDLAVGTGTLVPIWFNAWEYENESNMIFPLLFTIKKDYFSRVPKTFKKDNFLKNFKIITTTSILALADASIRVVTNHALGDALSIEDIANQYKSTKEKLEKVESVLNEWVDNVEAIKNAFETLLDTYAQDLSKILKKDETDEPIRFVIIVDDLDRCSPEVAIGILEKIKNFLLADKCIYVFGLNPKTIIHGVSIKYGNPNIEGREYLEKIFNYNFYVPEPSGIELFVNTEIDKIIHITEQDQKIKSLLVELGHVIKECRFFNPRKIKRILNRYMFFITLHSNEIDRYHHSNVIRLILMSEYYPEMFRLLLNSETSVRALTQDLSNLGDVSFDIRTFNSKYGIDVLSILPNINKYKELFNFDTDSTGGLYNLSRESLDVYKLTTIM